MHRRRLRSRFYWGLQKGRIRDFRGAWTLYCRQKHKEFFQILLRAANFVMDDEDQLQGASSTSNEYQSWISNADTLRHEETVREVMTAKLEAIIRGIGDIKINENYACSFTTTQGHMGLGPRDMRDDDQVCILRGCNFPVVLRQYGFSFKLVGAAYVAGFMYGEFLRSRWATGVREEEFEIV